MSTTLRRTPSGASSGAALSASGGGLWRHGVPLALDETATEAPEPPPLPDGFLVVHKPTNWTSFDVVGKVRYVLTKHFKQYGYKLGGRKKLKVGHGGTLDPLATGLLVLGVGRGTHSGVDVLR